MTTINRLPAALFVIFSSASLAISADWPQWRGPNRDGISNEKGLLQEWPAEGPKLLWEKSDLGTGYSTPAVVGNRIFLVNNKGLDDEFVQALNAKDGKPVWSTRIGKVGNPDQKPPYPGARSTPTVEGKVLYALGSDGDLVCMDTAQGKIRWQKSLRGDFAGVAGKWAYAESPLIDGEKLIVMPGGKDATIVAVNKQNGEVIWKSQVPEGDPAGYASAIVVNAAGVKQYVEFLGKGLVGVDAKDGKFLWRYDHTSAGSPANISTPTAADDCIYTGTHYSGGGLIHLSTDANGAIKADEVYFERKLPTAIGGQLLIGENMYGTNRESTLCVEFKTGQVKWKQDRGIAPASLSYADGRLYLHGENNGDLALIEASPEGYKEHGRFTPPNVPDNRTGKAWAYPAVANGRLFIHDWGHLWCYDVKADGANRAASRTRARN